MLVLVQDTLDAIEFARGDASSTLGSARAAMGRLEPFDLQFAAAGNQDCWNKNYRGMYLCNRLLRCTFKFLLDCCNV